MPVACQVMQVREARQDEWQTIVDVTFTAYEEFDDGSVRWKDYVINTTALLLTPSTDRRFVVDVDGAIGGVVLYLQPYEGNDCPEFRLLAVLPEHRDKHLGRLLITHCEELAKAEGFPAITLHTTVLMQTALGMYERRGYVKAPELDFAPTPEFQVWGYRLTF